MESETAREGDTHFQILRSTSFSDPSIKDTSKQSKMDALCELTNKVIQRPAHVDIPTPDYDQDLTFDYNSNGYLKSVDRISGDEHFLSAAYIKSNMSKEMKEINKDIQFRKQDANKRPEFLAKQHQMKTKALKKQEEKEKEESNELLSKLKSRSQQIEQDEKEKIEEKNKPEFMKVKLKSQSSATKIAT